MSANPMWRYRDAGGNVVVSELRVAGELVLPGSGLITEVAEGGGTNLVVKSVPSRLADRDPEAYARLDREIRALVRLARTFHGHPYPAGLPRLVGYDVDGEVPYVLLHPYRGVPVDTLSASHRIPFTVGLLNALHAVDVAGVVHSAVDHTTVRYEAASRLVQLTDFEHALVRGEHRRRSSARTASPEQEAGTGPADARDDVYGAGRLLHRVAVGPAASDGPLDPGLLGPELADQLTLMHAGRAADRPHANDLLVGYAARPDLTHETDLDAALRPGYDRFDEVRADKDARRSGRSPGRGRFPALVLAASALVVVVAVVAVLIAAGWVRI